MQQKLKFYRIFGLILYLFYSIFLMSLGLDLRVGANNDMSETSNWNTIFSLRSDDEWRQLWHSEKHKRCYQDLIDHMDWVCDKDIYKLRSKRDLIEVETLTSGPFLSPKEANMFGILRFKKTNNNNRRLRKRGIIDECCNGSVGCSWEEYAEYCPANRRIRT